MTSFECKIFTNVDLDKRFNMQTKHKTKQTSTRNQIQHARLLLGLHFSILELLKLAQRALLI